MFSLKGINWGFASNPLQVFYKPHCWRRGLNENPEAEIQSLQPQWGAGTVLLGVARSKLPSEFPQN